MTPQDGDRPAIDTGVPHNARVWDFWLNGKDNFEVDRRMGTTIREMFPVISDVALASREFLGRAVRYLAAEQGIRQFLDVGTGLPTADNTHQIAQAVAAESRIVYVDNDPLVLSHARALLTSSAEGSTDYVDADVHDTAAVLTGAARTLDLGKPVAVIMLGILNFVHSDADARRIVVELLAAFPPGSFLALTHPTLDLGGEMNVAAMAFYNQHATPKIRARSRTEVEALLAGLELVEPGLVASTRWRPVDPAPSDMPLWSAVARTS